jgi:predicted nucleotide-binding protein (sugar kinase/HSP70/actin superfamily)
MSTGAAEAFAAAFRNLGIDARVVPAGDEITYELAGKYMSGDECLPARVTVGNFLKAIKSAGSDTSSIAVFMPTASGPCRFGQYAPFMRHILDEMGHEEIDVVSPSSANGYSGIGTLAGPFMKLGWLAIAGSDALRKMLHIYRPMETKKGAADAAYAKALQIYCREMEGAGTSGTGAARILSGALEEARSIFREIPVDRSRELMLIGVVGEIFCRLSVFSNEDLIRQI